MRKTKAFFQEKNIFRIFALLVCMVSIFAMSGCGEKELPTAKIVRDDARTGGSLSFVYDQNQRKIFIGGQDEVVQFSNADETHNLEEGCRIGLKVTAPDEKLDLSSATLQMNGVHYSDFFESVNNQPQRFFNIYPRVSDKDRKITLKVKWQDGTKEQEYQIIIADGTKFMTKDGKVE